MENKITDPWEAGWGECGNNANLVGQVQCVLCDFSLKEGLRFSVPGDILLARDGGCKELMVQSSLLSDKVDHNANKHYDSNALALVYDRSIWTSQPPWEAGTIIIIFILQMWTLEACGHRGVKWFALDHAATK